MGTPGYIVRPTPTGSWEAVRVNYDGYPEGLGATLVRALALHPEGPEAVLRICFATSGWSSWPSHPHHPDAPDDALVTPETIWESSWSYLVDLARGVMEVRTGLDLDAEPTRTLLLDQLEGDELGASDLVLDELVSPRTRLERAAPPGRSASIERLLAALDLQGEHVGVATGVAAYNRHLHLQGQVVHLASSGFAGAVFHGADGPVPMPDAHRWLAAHHELVAEVVEGLGFVADPETPSHRVWLDLFDALFEEATPTDRAMPALPSPPVAAPPAQAPDLDALLARAGGDAGRLADAVTALAREAMPDADLEAIVDPSDDTLMIVRWYQVVAEQTSGKVALDLVSARELDPGAQIGDAVGVPEPAGFLAQLLPDLDAALTSQA